MRNLLRPMVRWALPAVVMWGFFSIALHAQELVLITCGDQDPCLYRRVYDFSAQGKNMVRTIGIQAANDVRLYRKARSVRVNSLPGLYRDFKSGLIRVLGRNGEMGNVVLPLKPANDASNALSAWEGAPLEYREQQKSKTGVSVPFDEFIALLNGSSPESMVVDFAKTEVRHADAHPKRKHLFAGAFKFAARSEELRIWRDELRTTMRGSLDLFRGEKADPARLEATLEEGLAAMRIYQLVAAEEQKEEALQEELTAVHRQLLERFAIAGILKKTGLHDAYLEKMNQIGLARWSRPELAAGIGPALQASAEWHHNRALELFDAKQYGRAFDEAQLANKRAPCNTVISENYLRFRVEFVNKNMIPTALEYENKERNILQQIVRELQGIGQEGALTPERIDYVRKRIADGERLDKDYLPLQFKKAEFLANLGELTAAQDVVTQIERTVQLDRSAAEDWLQLDASLRSKLAITRQRAEKSAQANINNGLFREALQAAEIGLKAEPANSKLLYYSALASAVMRDQPRTRQFVEQHLRIANPSCADASDAITTLFDLYRRKSARVKSAATDGKIPHWMSGEPYHLGEVFYDPLTGGFHQHVLLSGTEKGVSPTTTEFRWDGFMVTSITTTQGSVSAGRLVRERTLFEIEPKYDQEHICMTHVGPKANSAGERKTMTLRYLNSPDFDPLLAAKFTHQMSTRGWAGNPFFHPFIWNDIYVFDLVYDELGRIKEAIPVPPDASRPRSPFSETLKFAWEGSSKRLLSISGTKYRREMTYDRQGRLVSEKITYPKGNGKIEYMYAGKTMQLKQAKCNDDFFDKAHRLIIFYSIAQ